MGEYTTMNTNSLSEHHSAALLYITCPYISSLIYTKLKDTNNIQINDCYKNYKGETLHLIFCKYILGLNMKSVNHASLSELGRHPLHYDFAKRLLKYCYRLENLTTEFPLLKDAFLCSKLQMDFLYSYFFTNVSYFSNLKLVFENKYVVSFPSFNDSLVSFQSDKYF
jgi:hypothetical protein